MFRYNQTKLLASSMFMNGGNDGAGSHDVLTSCASFATLSTAYSSSGFCGRNSSSSSFSSSFPPSQCSSSRSISTASYNWTPVSVAGSGRSSASVSGEDSGISAHPKFYSQRSISQESDESGRQTCSPTCRAGSQGGEESMEEVLQYIKMEMESRGERIECLPSAAAKKAQVKKFKNVRKSKHYQCVICGDRPTGYHFDVLSCNGCKTFFRRTLVHKRVFKCSHGGNCVFTKDVRCFCRACRFKKCVAVGMNPKSIVINGESTKTKNGVVFFKSEDEVDDESTRDASPNPLENQTYFSCKKKTHHLAAISDLLNRERAVAVMRENSSMTLNRDLEHVMEKTSRAEGPYQFSPSHNWMTSDLYLICEYAKSFPAFQELAVKDKRVQLSQVGGLLVMLGRAYYSTDNLTPSFLKEACESNKCTESMCTAELQFEKDFLSIPVMWLQRIGADEKMFALLRAILLFWPVSEGLSEEARSVLTAQRNKYIDLLTANLFEKEGMSSGPTKYVAISSGLQMLYSLAERQRNNMILMDLSGNCDLTPFASEIWLRRSGS